MSAEATEYVYDYAGKSSLDRGDSGPRLQLSTSGGVAAHPYFFQGALKKPAISARCLRALSKVIASRFHLPAAMLEKILRESDPVVTVGGGLLRFEGFSGCCGAYARVDFEPDSYEAVHVSQGSTNVDFNAPMQEALNLVRNGESLSLAIGSGDLTLLRGSEQVVEEKVNLPKRWIRGFSEVQACMSRTQPVLRAGRIEALRFFRSIPASTDHRSEYCVMENGPGLRLGKTARGKHVKIRGLARLRLLETLAAEADELKVFSEGDGKSTLWQLGFGPIRFTLALSPESWRGFSGEGQTLGTLAFEIPAENVEKVRRLLQWQAEISLVEFSARTSLSPGEIELCLQNLATQGLVGFDGGRRAYFHRELPFHQKTIAKLNPRLKGARQLVEDDAVRWVSRSQDRREAIIRGSSGEYRVLYREGKWSCTCPWHGKHQGERGPCKHILAAGIAEKSGKGE